LEIPQRLTSTTPWPPKGALMTNSFAIEHPSEPNYLDVRLGKNL